MAYISLFFLSPAFSSSFSTTFALLLHFNTCIFGAHFFFAFSFSCFLAFSHFHLSAHFILFAAFCIFPLLFTRWTSPNILVSAKSKRLTEKNTYFSIYDTQRAIQHKWEYKKCHVMKRVQRRKKTTHNFTKNHTNAANLTYHTIKVNEDNNAAAIEREWMRSKYSTEHQR